MKKALSVLLALMMLVDIVAIGTVSASAEENTANTEFTDNYVLLDYIENTDGQYVNTGYKAGKDVTVTVDLEITAWNDDYAAIFGSRSGNHSANSFVMCRNGSNNSLRSEIGVKNNTDYAVGLNTRSNFSLGGSDKFSEEGLEIYLFGLNENNKLETNYGAASCKLYSCKITKGSDVVRYFVPVQQKSSGVAGLYDLQNGKFYESAGGKSFEKTAEHIHDFNEDGLCACGTCRHLTVDRDGSCAICGEESVFSLSRFNGNGEMDVRISFHDAVDLYVELDKNTVGAKNTLTVYDGDGNEIAVLKEGSDPVILHVTDDTVRFTSAKGGAAAKVKAIVPVYADQGPRFENPCTWNEVMYYEWNGQKVILSTTGGVQRHRFWSIRDWGTTDIPNHQFVPNCDTTMGKDSCYTHICYKCGKRIKTAYPLLWENDHHAKYDASGAAPVSDYQIHTDYDNWPYGYQYDTAIFFPAATSIFVKLKFMGEQYSYRWWGQFEIRDRDENLIAAYECPSADETSALGNFWKWYSCEVTGDAVRFDYYYDTYWREYCIGTSEAMIQEVTPRYDNGCVHSFDHVQAVSADRGYYFCSKCGYIERKEIVNIGSKAELLDFFKSIADGTDYRDVLVNLMTDVEDLKDYSGLTDRQFCGIFNGNNHTIKGVKDSGSRYGGLFHVLGTGAVVKDLTLADVKIVSTNDAGALAATAADRVKIKNVHVTSGSVTGTSSVGGLVGWFQRGADVENCSNAATVSGGRYGGGIGAALWNNSDDYQYTMKNCTNTGNISAYDQAGGIAGKLSTDNLYHDFSGCTNTGNVTAENDCAGGIVGRSEGGGNYKSCKNSGDIKGKSQAGGIIGWNEDDVIDFSYSENSGKISGATNSGGIIGSFRGSGAYNFEYCKNTQDVIADCSAGGIVGWLNNGNTSHNFKYCKNSGAVTQSERGDGAFGAGGIAGVIRGGCDFSESVNTGVIKAYYSAGGIIGFVDTHSDQTLYKCTNSASVTAEANCAGGITGQAYGGGDYRYCENAGAVSGKIAGGIVGWNEDDAIDFSHSSNSGEINATKNSGGHGGGIAGYLGDDDRDPIYNFESCSNIGGVTATDCAGGIVGCLQSDANPNEVHNLSWCKNQGAIRANNNCAGGIVGANYGNADFYRCTNSGSVYAKNDAGGIFGWDEDDRVYVLYASNSGTVNGNRSSGQIYGYAGGEVKKSSTVVGSVLSEGSIWIIVGVAVLAIGGVAALVIVKKKKKHALADGASTEDEE